LIEVLPAPAPSLPQKLARKGSRFFNQLSTSRLFQWRDYARFGPLEAVILALYCAVLAVVIPRHEQWADEVQAWLLASENSVWQILRYRLHYEGTPPLWHLILHGLSALHGTPVAMSWLGGFFASCGVYVFLRWSPFPVMIRVLAPFTLFLQYQYAVVARSYTLFALLVFSVCALYRTRRTFLFAMVAGILANLSTHALIVASVISAMYAYDVFCEGKYRPRRRKQLIPAAVCFLVLAGVGCYPGLPAPDINFAVSGSVSDGVLHRVLDRYVGETHNFYPIPPLPGPPVGPTPELPKPSSTRSPAQWVAWQINHRDRNADGFPLPQSRLRSWAEFVVSLASQATWPVANSNLLACLFFGILFAWLRARRGLRALLPWFTLMIFGQVIWVADHHVGMLFILILAGIWIAAERPSAPAASAPLNGMFVSVFAVVLALQVVWSAVCITNDIRKPYDPAPETAKWLLAHPVERTAAFHYWSVAMQPFFGSQPFTNMPSRYWIWSWKANPDPYYQEVIADHPDRIVDAVEFPTEGQMRDQWVPLNHIPTEEERRTLPWDYALQYFHANGYVETHRFCGTRFLRMGTDFMDCNLILEPVQRAAAN
jgi:hypothetical protein